jgi:hypothetical protein
MKWFNGLPDLAKDKIVVRIERLRELGHELRRPEADYLCDDIYELRVKQSGINYRVLYFFSGRQLVVLAQGFAKQMARVPEIEIRMAIRRKMKFTSLPTRHTLKGQV